MFSTIMRTISINTNIHCDSCVSKVDTELKKLEGLESWSVDLNKEHRPLIATGSGLSKFQVIEALDRAGYQEVRSYDHTYSSRASFWADGHKWKRAVFNTFNCLVGCSIGDFGALIILQRYFPGTPMATQMGIAIIAGLFTSILLETVLLKRREGFGWKLAFRTALSMSFISMIGMEIAMNLTDLAITGGKAAFGTISYWLAFIPAMIIGFLAPLPYNYYKLKKFNKACH